MDLIGSGLTPLPEKKFSNVQIGSLDKWQIKCNCKHKFCLSKGKKQSCCSTVGSVEDLRTLDRWFEPPSSAIILSED